MEKGEILRQARVKKGWSQEKLSEWLNVSRMAISQYETGKVNPPDEILFRTAILTNDKEAFKQVFALMGADIFDAISIQAKLSDMCVIGG